MTPRHLLIPLLLLSGLLVSACALGGMIQQTGSVSTQAPAVPTTAATPTETFTQPTSAPETPQAPAETAPEVILSSGALANYRSHLLLTLSGQDAQGSTTTSRLEVMEEVDKAHNTRHRLARTEVQGQRPGSLDLYQSDQGIFLVSSETAGCVKTAVQNPSVLIDRAPGPADLIQSLKRGDLIGKAEKIDSAVTDHYGMMGVKISFGKAEKSAGDIWIDIQNGLVVRQDGRAEGAFSLGGGASYGRIDWQYDLNAAANVTVGLPPDCQALANNDLPLPPNSGDPAQNGAELSFQVQTKPALVMGFFRGELPKRGWTIETDAGGGAIFEMDASKDGKKLHITVTALDLGARVTIQRK
jgi:hypothetical protein